MKKNSYKNSIAWLVVSLIIFTGGIIFAALMPLLVHSYTEDNTTEYTATFVSLEKDNNWFMITVEEYGCQLMLDEGMITDLDALQELNIGEVVFFRLSGANNPLNDVNVKQHTILTLRTENKNISTLESLLNYEVKQNKKAQIVIIAVSVIFIFVFVSALINVLRIYLIKRKMQNQ